MNFKDYNNMSKEDRAKVPFKEKPTLLKVSLGVITVMVVLIVFGVFKSAKHPSEAKAPLKTWEQMSMDEKGGYLDSMMKNDYEIPSWVQSQVKPLAKYSEEVGFKDNDKFNVDQILTKRIYMTGDMVCNNGFGVKVSCSYKCLFIYNGKGKYTFVNAEIGEQ